MESPIITRRSALAGAIVAAGSAALPSAGQTPAAAPAPAKLKGRIKQSVSRWCFGGVSLDDLCIRGKAMGLVGIDLLNEDEWPVAAKHGLICTMANAIGGIGDAWNRVENHDRLVKDAERLIPAVAKAGIANLITFSGNRRGLSDAEGMDNCVRGLKRILPLAEQHKVNIIMELLNSKRSHKDYQCDHTAWGVELCKRTGSPRMKLLYDIFHMQIMEGDLCDTIRENIAFIGHFHTGGVPGRAEIDETQEINYARVCRTIAEVGYTGFVAHEFVPGRRDGMASLQQAIRICDV